MNSTTQAFAVWLTGLPASGKSSITAVMARELSAAGVRVEVLESDALRRQLTPEPTYDAAERDLFYRAVAYFASRFVAHGVPVIVDATGHRRVYRDFARSLIPQFIEVAVLCPLAVCAQRDRKGTYRGGASGEHTAVPGLQVPYEPPERPEVRVDSEHDSPDLCAGTILEALRTRGWVTSAG